MLQFVYVWSFWSNMTPYGRYGPLGSVWFNIDFMAQYGFLWSCTVPYGPVCSLMVPYASVWSSLVSYGLIWSCMVSFHHIWLCLVTQSHIDSKRKFDFFFFKCLKTHNSFRYFYICSTHRTASQIFCLFLKEPVKFNQCFDCSQIL